MNPKTTDSKTSERMRDALELIVSTLEDEIGRARARVGALVASVSADAAGLVERHKHDGADAVEGSILAMHVRELATAQAQLADKRERLREMRSVIEFAERAASNRKARP
jgi:hypothetical protein